MEEAINPYHEGQGGEGGMHGAEEALVQREKEQLKMMKSKRKSNTNSPTPLAPFGMSDDDDDEEDEEEVVTFRIGGQYVPAVASK